MKRARVGIAAATLAVASLAIFAQACRYGLIIGDDSFNIAYNPFLAEFGFDSFFRIWSGFYLKLFIPVTLTAWSLLTELARVLHLPEASTYHGANLVLHWLNGLLVFLLARPLLSPKGRRDEIALLAALFFVCHPLQATSVAWVTGLKDVLSCTFGLAALLAFTRAGVGVRKADSSLLVELESPGYYVAASAAFALALLSKPNMVVLAPLAVLIARKSGRDLKGALLAVAPWLVAVALVVVLTAGQQAELDPAAIAPVWVRPFAALDSIAFYAWKTLVPFPLPHEYGRTIEARRHTASFWLCATAIAGVAALCWRLRSRMPGVGTGLAFAVVALLPVLGFVPYIHQQYCDVANRYMYFPMVGFSLSLAFALERARSRKTLVAFAAVLLAFSALAFERTRFFASDEVFYAEILKYDPYNDFATGNYGVLMLRQRRLDEALQRAEAGYLRSATHRARLRLVEALLAVRRGPEAVKLMRDATDASPSFSYRRFELGHALIFTGKLHDGVAELSRAAAEKPELRQEPPPAFIGELYQLELLGPEARATARAAAAQLPGFHSFKMLVDQKAAPAR